MNSFHSRRIDTARLWLSLGHHDRTGAWRIELRRADGKFIRAVTPKDFGMQRDCVGRAADMTRNN